MSIIEAIAKRAGVNPSEGKSKYGSVEFADAKNKKYPVDTPEHAKAAWSYINMPKNASKYSSGDLATIKSKIRAAMKRHGIHAASENVLVTSEYATALNGALPEHIMYMPAGASTLNPSVDGQPRQINVEVSQATADTLQAELDKLLVENVRPYIDFDHKAGAAAAIPKRFTWKDGEGVMLELDWTGAGKTAVSGRDYSYFSPTFLLNESGNPAGLPKSGAIGALTNNPAFRQIKRIYASEAPVGCFATFEAGYDPSGNLIFWDKEFSTTGAECAETGGIDEMTEEEATALRTELETVRADNSRLTEAAKTKKDTSELEVLRAENQSLRESIEAQRIESVNAACEQLIESAVKDGKIAPKNDTVKAGLKKWFLADAASAKAHIESLPANPAFKTVVTVSGAHRDVGKPQPVQDTTLNGSNNGKLCKAAVKEYQASHSGVSFEDAWKICADMKPELFAEAN